MNWQVACHGSAASGRIALSRWVTLAFMALAVTTASGQERTAPAVRHWRPVGTSSPALGAPAHSASPSAARAAQASHHAPEPPTLPPRSPAGQVPPVAQAGYEAMPYTEASCGVFDGGFSDGGCDGYAFCPPGCGCETPACDDVPLLACDSVGEIWLSGEYLLWSVSDYDLPPLVTSSAAGTAPENTGVLGHANTRVLLGGDSDAVTASGFRIAGGWWFDAAQSAGLEFSYAGLPGRNERDTWRSSDFPLLGRPVFDTGSGSESAMLVAHPDLLSGHVSVQTSTEFHHVGAIRRARLSQSRYRRVDSLVGFRFSSLEEALLVEQRSRFSTGTGQVIAGTTLDLVDRFETDNRFYGLLLGLDLREQIGDWTFSARGSLSLGNTHAELLVDGRTRTTVPGGGSSTAIGGLLAQQTNIGDTSRNKFALMPELSLGLSTHLSECLELTVGYHLLYLNNAARPGEQINRRVSQFPPEPPVGSRDPRLEFQFGDVLIHGLQTGLVYRF